MPYGITQYYLPPGRGDIPAFPVFTRLRRSSSDHNIDAARSLQHCAVAPAADVDRKAAAVDGPTDGHSTVMECLHGSVVEPTIAP